MHITSNRLVMIAMLILAFSFACYAKSISESNKAPFTESIGKTSSHKTATNLSENIPNESDVARIKQTELRAELYKEMIEHFKWALDIVVGALGAVVVIALAGLGYIGYVKTREYNRILAEAHQAAKNAENWEKQAKNKLDSIDTLVKDKLAQISKEAEKQRNISELFSKSLNAVQNKDYTLAADYSEQILNIDLKNARALSNLAGALSDQATTKKGEQAEKLLREACQKCSMALANDPNYHLALTNWGVALSKLARIKGDDGADKFFEQAYEKFKSALVIEPSVYQAWYNWGTSLADQAKTKRGDTADKLFEQAFDKYEKAVAIKPDVYDLWFCWANDLSAQARTKHVQQAKRLFKQACEKYEKAVAIKPEEHAAWNNWGNAIFAQMSPRPHSNPIQVFDDVVDKYLHAESLKPGSSAYSLACVYGWLPDARKCRKWLEAAERAGTLQPLDKAMADPCFRSVRDKEWFKQIRWPDESK